MAEKQKSSFFSRLFNSFRNSLRKSTYINNDNSKETTVIIRKLGFTSGVQQKNTSFGLKKSNSTPSDLSKFSKNTNQILLHEKEFDNFQNLIKNTQLKTSIPYDEINKINLNLNDRKLTNEEVYEQKKSNYINSNIISVSENFGPTSLSNGNIKIIESFEKLQQSEKISINNDDFAPAILNAVSTGTQAIQGILLNDNTHLSSDNNNITVFLDKFNQNTRDNIIKDIKNISQYKTLGDIENICNVLSSSVSFDVKITRNGAIDNLGSSNKFYKEKANEIKEIREIRIEDSKLIIPKNLVKNIIEKSNKKEILKKKAGDHLIGNFESIEYEKTITDNQGNQITRL